jgi:hypothetical protein
MLIDITLMMKPALNACYAGLLADEAQFVYSRTPGCSAEDLSARAQTKLSSGEK